MDNKNKRDIKNINNKIVKIMNKLTVHKMINLVGSAGDKRQIYYADYDLYESITKRNVNKLYMHFINIFRQINQNKTAIVSDLKCGEDHNGDAIRWDWNQLRRGRQTIDDKEYLFKDCLMHNAIIKLDVIMFLNSRFMEITEVYGVNHRLDGFTQRLYKYMEAIENEKYFKSLKMLYSLLKNHINEKTKKAFIKYFNSPSGYLYTIKSDLETLKNIINVDKKNKFSISQIKSALELIKENLSKFEIKNIVNKITILKNKKSMLPHIDKQLNKITKYLNADVERFLKNSA